MNIFIKVAGVAAITAAGLMVLMAVVKLREQLGEGK